MADGMKVDTAEIRSHASKIEDLVARFHAVKTASAHIRQDDQAYGLLCGWISAILESRHAKQDELIAYVQENLMLVLQGLDTTVIAYDAVESDNGDLMNKYGRS
ncbi:type VII secretion target [Dactylosporangium sp. NPDC005572]|uniref:type VII secretion target n=1 Tax=Dactylosporangium sp. NPDC005572 TaxID=3156889 RepID=UPI0033B525EB